MRRLHLVIRGAVTVLATLMVLVIPWGIGDMVLALCRRLSQPPFVLLNIRDILATFGVLLAVLIAIEIFVHITLYLRVRDGAVSMSLGVTYWLISKKI